MHHNQADEQRILNQAAEWFARLQDQSLHAQELAQWQAWLAADPAHARVWQRVEAISQPFKQLATTVPAATARATLKQVQSVERRRTLRRLGLGVTVLASGLLMRQALPWRGWLNAYAIAHAGYRTQIGERKTWRLPEGTLLALNTATAVDVHFDPHVRRIVLHQGEILVTTARDLQRPSRPLVVDTLHARLTALGTRFTVRGDLQGGHVAVFEGAVRIRPHDAASVDILAGQQARFTQSGVIADGRADLAREAWSRGQIVADNLPLANFIAELNRYSNVPICVQPAVANLHLVGVYPLNHPTQDIPLILAAIENVLPVRIHQDAAVGLAITAR